MKVPKPSVRPNKKKTIAALLAGVLVFLFVSGCTRSNNGSNLMSVVYKNTAGGHASKVFLRCVPSNTNLGRGHSDDEYKYPTDTRYYEWGRDGAESKDPITVVTKDNVTMTVVGTFNFALNTSCGNKDKDGNYDGGVIRKFHEQIGLRAGANGDEIPKDWNSILAQYVAQPLNRALDNATKNYTWLELYGNQAKKAEWQRQVGLLMTQYVQDQTHEDYFCNPDFRGSGDCGQPTLTVQQPVPPANIQAALNDAQAAIQENAANEARVKSNKSEAAAIAELVKVLGPEGFVLYQAIKDKQITVVPIPQGGAINVTPPK